MKLTELLVNQKLVVQLAWGEQKIEFPSNVIELDDSSVYVTPYYHNESPLEINISLDNGVICNLFTDSINTKQRVSWKNVNLSTVNRNGKVVYCIKTRGFNNVATPDDRRLNDRIIVEAPARAFDGGSEAGVSVTVHDISDNGISFHAPESFAPRSQQIVIEFTDNVEEKIFNVRVECTITRIVNNVEDNKMIGCRITEKNRDYQVYELLKRLKDKNHNKIKKIEVNEPKVVSKDELSEAADGENSESSEG